MTKTTMAASLMMALACQVALAETYYVSAGAGSDSAAGSEAQPFATINHALAVMHSGDTCLIKQGIYRERVAVNTDNVTLKAYPNDFVLITGTQRAGAWEAFTMPTTGVACMRTQVAAKPYEVFINGDMAQLARFPDKTAPMTSNRDWVDTFVHADTGLIEFTAEKPANFADYTDGMYVGIHTNATTYKNKGIASWYTFDVPIVKVEGSSLVVDKTQSSSGYLGKGYGIDNGLGYIIGAKAALDAPNEWYSDGQYVYVIFPQGVDPATARVELRTELYVITLAAKGTTLENLNFKAGAVLVSGDGNTIDHCSFRYISPLTHNPVGSGTDDGQSAASQWGTKDNASAGVYVAGHHNKFTSSYFAQSWASGLTLYGDDNLVENSIVEDVDWMARRNAGINSFGNDNVIRHCTIRNVGAACIEGGNWNWLRKYAMRNVWEYNYLHDATHLVVDQACIYVNQQIGNLPQSDTVIRYNIAQNARGPEKGKFSKTCVGVYTDNNTSGYVVHHNVIINTHEGIRYNDFRDGEEAGKHLAYYNNTFYQCGRNFILNKTPTTKFFDADLHLTNNVGVGPGIGLLEKYGDREFPQNYEKLDPAVLVDPASLNFKLQGAALKLPAYPVQVYDPALDPDAGKINYVGAMDPAQEPFKAGATISVPDFAAEKTLLAR